MKTTLKEEFGLQTAVIHNPEIGIWCGYVGLPASHPLFGLTEEHLYDLVEVHGGVTWTDNCLPNQEPDGLWWVGFDCAHAGDLIPMLENLPEEIRDKLKAQAKEFVAALLDIPLSEMQDDGVADEYRDEVFVAAEVAYLAMQLSGRMENA